MKISIVAQTQCWASFFVLVQWWGVEIAPNNCAHCADVAMCAHVKIVSHCADAFLHTSVKEIPSCVPIGALSLILHLTVQHQVNAALHEQQKFDALPNIEC